MHMAAVLGNGCTVRQSAATFSAAPVAGCAGQGSGSSPTPGRIARDEIRRVDGSVQTVHHHRHHHRGIVSTCK